MDNDPCNNPIIQQYFERDYFDKTLNLQKFFLKPLAASVTRQLAKKMAVTRRKTQEKQMHQTDNMEYDKVNN